MAELQGVKVIDMVGGDVIKVAYDSAEYVKLADKTKNKKGDIALVVDGWGNQKAGEYYRLINEDHPLWDNDPEEYVHINGKHGDASCFIRRVEIFRKVETPTLDSRVTKLEQDVAELQAAENDVVDVPTEKPTYKKGDKIRVVAAEDTDEEYEDGDILTVKGYAYAGRLIYVQEHKRGLFPREVEPATPKVGDKVRVVAAVEPEGHYVNGDVLTIKSINQFGNILVNENIQLLYSYEFELMTTAEVKVWEKEEAEQQAQEQRPAVGDYAKVVDDKYHDAEIDEIVKIVVDEKDRQPYRCESLNGDYAGWFFENQLEKVSMSDEEAEEAEKWAKIGRKPNEYKPDDIAEVVNSPNASPEGTLVVVIDVDSTGIYATGWSAVLRRNIVFRYDRMDLKLVTPVERRFDKQ